MKMPSERWYVGRGSRMYVEVMSKVPVCTPKGLTFVSNAVREASLKSMMAPPDESVAAAAPAASGALGGARVGRGRPRMRSPLTRGSGVCAGI